jgi:hypothetical protein
MPKHRLSFWRTTAASATATLALTALVIGLVAWVLRQPGGAPFWAGCLCSSLAVLIVPLTAVSGLVAAGGLIALRRDALEANARPYQPSAPREATPGLLIGAMRAVFGRRIFGLRPGDWVEIRSLDEILQTLDDNGTLDGLPFMPEMAAYCGTRARVLRRVDKLNDWIHHTGLKRMRRLVLLADLRCDGSAHGQCQSNCHLRWRTAWLRPADWQGSANKSPDRFAPKQSQLAALSALASRQNDADTEKRYVCQATELTTGGTPLRMVDPRHYARDLLTGNVRLKPFCAGVAIECFNRIQRMRGGPVFPHYTVGITTVSPHEALDLQPGELVRVKQKSLIEPTLNSQSKNRGLYFDKEMIRFCGGEYRVKARAERIIVEKTGELRQLTNPCIILEGVTASGEYQGFNPENEYIFWREIWLERVLPVIVPAAALVNSKTYGVP